MALPPLRAIEANEAQLSSTHLQGPDENNEAAMVAEFFPEQQPLRHIGDISDHRLLAVEPGQPLGLVNTQVTRITPDSVSLSRAASTTVDPDAVAFEGPVQLSAGQMTPRARAFLLPPLKELSHADYLLRAGGTEARLSEEHWERAVEQLQRGYGASDVARALNVDAGQVTIVHSQLIDIHLESIAAEPSERSPSARSGSPGISDVSMTPPDETSPCGTPVPAAELAEVKRLQKQGLGTRNRDGTPTAFGEAIGKLGTSARDPTSALNHVGRVLGKEMILSGQSLKQIRTALGISGSAISALKREVLAALGAPAPRGTPVSAAELAEAKELQKLGLGTRNSEGTPTAFGKIIGKNGTSATDKNSALNPVGRALAQEMILSGQSLKQIRTALGISNFSIVSLRREVLKRGSADANVNSHAPQVESSEMAAARSRGLKSRPQERGRNLGR